MLPPTGRVGIGSGHVMPDLAREIARMDGLQVVTTDLDVAVELAGAPGIALTVTAGEVISGTPYLAGAGCARTLETIRLDVAVIQVDGIQEAGLSIAEPRMIPTVRALLSRAARVIVVAEHDAFGRAARSPLAGLGRPSTLVAHTQPVGPIGDALARAGVTIALTA